MTVCVNYPCEMCKNCIGMINNWEIGCKAFPDGIPKEIFFSANVKTRKECANGYKYEYDENKDVLKKK